MKKTIKSSPSSAIGTKINSADVMIILLCLVCIAAMIFRFGFIEQVEYSATKDNVNISFVIEGISEGNVEYIKNGDELWLSDANVPLGTLSSITGILPSTEYVYGDDGTITQKQSVNGKVDLRGIISAQGEMTNSGFMLNGTEYISPNMTVAIHTKTLSVYLTILDISALATE